MLSDEMIQPNFRIYNPKPKFETYFKDIYKYYFLDCHYSIQQRYQTLHLAMSYFTQSIMGLSNINHKNIDLLAATCLLLGSKLDEIDYNLPSFEYILYHMKNSEHMKNYSLKFSKQEHIDLEKYIVTSLDWNLSQLTPYHFLQALLSQGVVLSHEKVKVELTGESNQYENVNVKTPQESGKLINL